jgi:predicted nucleotidyltransferase
VINTFDMMFARRTEIEQVLARYGASNLRVFGFVARREDGPDSDINCLIELAPGSTLLTLASVQFELEDLLGREVDLGSNLKEPVWHRIQADLIQLF